MLLLSPVFYYEKIRERFANSYLAEDTTQTIVGIDCEGNNFYEIGQAPYRKL